LHGRVAEALDSLYAANRTPHLAELAHHFFEAAEAADAGKAIDYATQAGDQATSQLAYEEAVTQYQRALRALDLKPPEDAERRCDLLLHLGLAANRAGDFGTAKEAFRGATDLARKQGATEQLGRAALGAVEGVEPGDEPAIAALQEALSALGEGDSAIRARVLAVLALESRFCAPRDQTAAASREAVEMARRLGEKQALAETLRIRHLVLWGPENIEDRLATADEIVRLAEEL
jgi:predicted ATPase